MPSSSSDIFSLGTTACNIAPGASLAQWVDFGAYATSVQVKYFTGGSLEIIGAPFGVTNQGGFSNVLSGNLGYVMGTAEVQSIDGPCRFYLRATGATVTALMMVGQTASNPRV